MSVCPFCKNALDNPGSPLCSTCGKNPADHPSLQGRQLESSPLDDDFLSDNASAKALDFERHGHASVDPSVMSRDIGDSLDMFDDPKATPDLELASAPIAAPIAAPKRLRIEGPSEQQIDPREVGVVAGFGPKPKNIFGTIPYAFIVWNRNAALRKMLGEQRTEVTKIESARDDRWVAVAELADKRARNDARLAEDFAAIDASRTTESSEKSQLENKLQSLQASAQSIDQQVDAARKEVEAQKTEAADRQRQADMANEAFVQIRDQSARVDDQIRSIDAQKARGEIASAQADLQIQGLRAQQETRAQQGAGAQSAAEQTRLAAALARRTWLESSERLEALLAQQRDAQRKVANVGAVGHARVSTASNEVRRTMILLGKHCLALKVLPTTDLGEHPKAIHDLDETHARALTRLETITRAMALADWGSVRTGFVMVGIIVVLVLGGLIALVNLLK